MRTHGSYTSPRPGAGQHGLRRHRRAAAAGLLAALATACGPSASERPELVLVAGRVITLDPATPDARAVAIAGGRIVAVGGIELAERWAGGATRVVNLGDVTVAPALVDHHAHLYNVGLTLLNDAAGERLFLDLSRDTSLAGIGARVARRARGLVSGQWVLGAGWSQGLWGTQALPDHETLTAAAPRHPVFLARVDGHAGWANRRALEEGGLWPPAADPPGGAAPRAPDGTPRGVLLERANEPLTRRIPQPAEADVIEGFRLAAEALAARGVVEAYDAGALAFPGVVALDDDLGRPLALLRRADSAAPLPIAVNLMVPAPSGLADSILSADSIRPLSSRVRITHLKLFADGALGSRGAALTHPYADDPGTSGVPRMTAEEIGTLARRALDRGLGVATHAIGDEAVRRALDAYEAILRERPDLDPTRLRIEHFSYAREEDLHRAVRLRLTLSIQSNFNALPDERPTFGAMRVGEANEARVYPWARLAGMGAALAEGSDYFGRPGPPLAGFLATLERRGSVGEDRPEPEGRALAWRMNATLFPPAGPARDPVLRPGAAADLVVLSADPLTAPREALGGIEVLATLRAGAPTHLTDRLRPLLGDTRPR